MLDTLANQSIFFLFVYRAQAQARRRLLMRIIINVVLMLVVMVIVHFLERRFLLLLLLYHVIFLEDCIMLLISNLRINKVSESDFLFLFRTLFSLFSSCGSWLLLFDIFFIFDIKIFDFSRQVLLRLLRTRRRSRIRRRRMRRRSTCAKLNKCAIEFHGHCHVTVTRQHCGFIFRKNVRLLFR